MASTSVEEDNGISEQVLDDLRKLLWGREIKDDLFNRWTQGFVFSGDEPTALVQLEGGPCAVIAPVQTFLMKNLIFSKRKFNWKTITEEEKDEILTAAMVDILVSVKSREDYIIVLHHGEPLDEGETTEENTPSTDEGESSPKKQKISHEHFHEGLRCSKCSSQEELETLLHNHLGAFKNRYGVLLLLYSIILTKGIDQIKNEVEDPSEPLIDDTYGHGSQSMINLLLTSRATSNVWDNDKDVSGLKLHGLCKRATIGFLTLLEHLRYCEVGWYFKNPEYPIWLLGSETHLTVLFSEDPTLVTLESPEASARRIFSTFDSEGSGFIAVSLLGDLLQALDLVSEPEYVKIMAEKLDPEQLGIVTLNGFMEEFFPSDPSQDNSLSFPLFHYNGLPRSNPDNKVVYQEAKAVIMDTPELQIITDSSAIKTCLMTKWPTIDIQWKNGHIPSLN